MLSGLLPEFLVSANDRTEARLFVQQAFREHHCAAGCSGGMGEQVDFHLQGRLSLVGKTNKYAVVMLCDTFHGGSLHRVLESTKEWPREGRIQKRLLRVGSFQF